MARLYPLGLVCIVLSLTPLATVLGQADAQRRQASLDTSFFTDQLYPIMHNVQCNLCHSDNGVASGTGLEFPVAEASQEEIAAFGLKLMDYVDRDDPQQSLLLLMPTNREEHTGGERIKPGSRQEQQLLRWINFLAGLSEEQIEEAQVRIAQAEQLSLQPLSIRRLTHSQYNHTVRDLLGDNSQPANRFPGEDFVRGFKNQAEAQGISPLQAEAYAKAAERLAASAFRGGDPRNLLPDATQAAKPMALASDFVTQFGMKAFRRPLNAKEQRVYVELFKQEFERDADFFSGAKIVVETMLQSPHFLFRLRRDGDSHLEQYEIASRLSYFLWDTMPSAEMLQAAARGEFSQPERIEATVRRMLDDPRAKSSMREFLAQWMRFDRVLGATRDRRRYGQFNTEVAAAMVEETQMLFDYLIWEDRNFMEFFTADYSFLTSELAKLYDLPAPDAEYAMVRYPADTGRSGVLGHGSFLVATSKPAETSPTERGLFVRNHFLGQEVPPPPPGVNTSLPEITEDQPMTNRQRLELHLNSEACSNCHRLIDPIGFGFEQYNAIGGFEKDYVPQSTQEPSGSAASTTPARTSATSGYIQGMKDSDFSTPKELGRILAQNEACQKCIVKQLFRYAFGREETPGDQAVINGAMLSFRQSGFQFRELIVALAMADCSTKQIDAK